MDNSMGRMPRWLAQAAKSAGFFFFFWVLKGKVRTGSSEQGRTLPSNTKTRIGQTLGIVLGTLDTLQSRRLAESLQIAEW